MKKKQSRIKNAKKLRSKIKKLNIVRLVVHKTSRHIYSQIISSDGSKVLASASTVEEKISKKVKNTGNKDAACMVGKFIAKRALEKGINRVAFDRSGFLYHGRIKSLADTARNFGLFF